MTMIPFPGTYHGERDELTGMFPSARLSLKAIAGPLRGQQFMFDGGPFVIGRAPTCTVPIPSKGVSRAHAKIEYGNGGYWLLPDKTVNGTRLNGILVQAPCQLSDRDQIAIYDSTFVVTYREPGQDLDEDDLAPPPPPPAPPPPFAAPPPYAAQPYPMAGQYPTAGPYPTAAQYPSAQYPPPYPPQAYPAYPPLQYPAPPSYPTIAGAPPPSLARPSLQSMPYMGAPPAPRRWPVWVGVSAGLLVLVAAVVIVTVKLVEPTVTPFVGPAAAVAAPTNQVAGTVPPPAPPPAAVVAPPPQPAVAPKPTPPPAPPSPPPAAKLVGVLAVEMFVVQENGGSKVLVNEIAPRVHNSGHWTLDGASISQFEQHIRAIAGWPLGKPVRHGEVTMTNLIGDEPAIYPQDLPHRPILIPHGMGEVSGNVSVETDSNFDRAGFFADAFARARLGPFEARLVTGFVLRAPFVMNKPNPWDAIGIGLRYPVGPQFVVGLDYTERQPLRAEIRGTDVAANVERKLLLLPRVAVDGLGGLEFSQRENPGNAFTVYAEGRVQFELLDRLSFEAQTHLDLHLAGELFDYTAGLSVAARVVVAASPDLDIFAQAGNSLLPDAQLFTGLVGASWRPH